MNQKFTLVVVVTPLCIIISTSNCLSYQKRYIKYYITYKTFSKQLGISTTTIPQRAAGFFLFTSADYRINKNLDLETENKSFTHADLWHILNVSS